MLKNPTYDPRIKRAEIASSGNMKVLPKKEDKMLKSWYIRSMNFSKTTFCFCIEFFAILGDMRAKNKSSLNPIFRKQTAFLFISPAEAGSQILMR